MVVVAPAARSRRKARVQSTPRLAVEQRVDLDADHHRELAGADDVPRVRRGVGDAIPAGAC